MYSSGHRNPPRRDLMSIGAFGLLFALLWPMSLEARPRAMRFEQLSIEDGLSQSVVTCMLQDQTGFLWLGTQDGLNRYDGYSFTVYRNDNSDDDSLPHDLILALAEDPSGDLWVGTEGGGLVRWRRTSDSFVSYRREEDDPTSLSGDRVIALTHDPMGALWIGTQDGGLSRLEETPEGEVTFSRFSHDPEDPSSLAHDQLGALYLDRRGRLWVGTWGGLDLYDPELQSFVHHRHDSADPSSLSSNRVRAITEDQHGALWIGTLGGLNRLDPRTGRVERYLHDPAEPTSLSHDWVRSLLSDASGRLWVGTDGGLNLWQPNSGNFARYHPDPTDPTSLASDQVPAIFQDRGGVMWVSAVGSGVGKWNPSTWSFPHTWSEDDVGASNMVFALSEDPDGALWVGTFGGGLERIERNPEDGGEGRRTRYRHKPGDPSSLGDDRVTALLHDRQGMLWVGTVGGGLHRFSQGLFERYVNDPGQPDSLSNNAVTALFENRRGQLWIGTHGGGLNLYRGDGFFLSFRHDPDNETSLSNDRVLSLAEDRKGFMWLATDGGGINRFHPATGAFLRIQHDPDVSGSLSSNEPNVVYADSEDRLWVGTEGSGLDLMEGFDDSTGQAFFRNFSRTDGLPSDTVWGIRSDLEGKLWLSTNKGLARLDPETDSFTTYTTSHGLQSNEFNKGADFASPSGELFFGGVNGFNAFFPDKIESNPHVPAVVVTSFTRTGQPVNLGRPIYDIREIELGYRDYFFSFEVAALDYTAPRENRYRYKLEGFDTDWVDLGDRRQVTFTNLDAGRYTLRLKGSNNDGVWNEEAASVVIAIAPAPWKSRWALSFYTLSIVAFIAALIHRQRRQVQRERDNARHEREIARLERDNARRERLRSEERRRLLEELGAKNEELERFNYTVSHDLKSPLVTIKGFLGLLEKDAVAGHIDRVRHDARRIGAAADRMRRLLDELLELSTVGKQVRPPEEVSFARLADEALENLAIQVSEKRVEVVVAPNLPMVFGDRLRLLQLVQNLFVNAIKYMGDQDAPRVDLGMRHDPKDGTAGSIQRVFFVRDNGVGIDERYQKRVFGLFERLDTGDEGTGVGLALAKRIVEMHGGRIWIESRGVGHGSRFCFTLGDSCFRDGARSEQTSTVVDAGDRFRRTGQ